MSEKGLTNISLKKINKSKVYQYIYRKKTTSKLQIVQELQMGLSTGYVVTENSIQQNPVFSNINLSDIQTKIRNNKLLIVFLLSAYIVRERCALCLCMINLYAHLSHLSLIRFSESPELCIS